MIVAVVPAKDLHGAKTRLASVLSQEERRALCTAMLTDVLTALAQVRAIGQTLVVSRQPELVALARGVGADVCEEPRNLGHTEAVRSATAALVARGVEGMLTIPGDVPAVSPHELDTLLAASDVDRSVVFAPSRNGLGTNGVVLRPPDLIPLRFGEPSFPNHLAAAERAGLAVRVLELPGLGLDVDSPSDLAALMASPCGRCTRHLLDEMALRRRAFGLSTKELSHAP